MTSTCIVALVGLAILGSVFADVPRINKKRNANGNLSRRQKNAILNKHNEYRRMEKASDMIDMTWDSNLQKLAQEAADTCEYQHTANLNDGGRGENIAVDSASIMLADMPVTRWWEEIKDYTYSTKFCDKVCGHYTQVVNAGSTKVGCGVKWCNAIKRWNNPQTNTPYAGWIFFCQYQGPQYSDTRPFTCKSSNLEDCNYVKPVVQITGVVTLQEACRNTGSGLVVSQFPTGCRNLYCKNANGDMLAAKSMLGVPCAVGKVCNDNEECVDDPTDEANSLDGDCLYGMNQPWAESFCEQYKHTTWLCEGQNAGDCCVVCSKKEKRSFDQK